MKKQSLLLMSIVLAFAACTQQHLKLENENIAAVFDPSDGSLISLVNKQTGWKVVDRETLGQSFEMLVPLEERRLHLVNGTEQKRPDIKTYPDSIVFTWKSLKSKHINSSLEITFTGTVTLGKDGLAYTGRVDNRSAHTVEYIAWPFLGEVTIPGKDKDFISQTRNNTKNLYPAFHGEHGYWGVEYPTQTDLLPEGSFLLARNNEQGMYVCSKQFYPSQMVICSFELIPGYEINNRNPETDEMDGQMVRIQFKANHVVYAQPQSAVTLEPLSLKLYKGDWYRGADIYKEWKQTQTTAQVFNSPSWIKEPQTWQKINISNGKDLINYAHDAKAQGVSVLEVNGWKKNGKENYIDMVDGLPEALGECKKLGVQVVLGMNFTSVDPHSDWYNNELKNYLITDPFGIVYDRSIVCNHAKGFQETTRREYTKATAIMDAAGIICDDNNHRNKTFYCFDPGHEHTIPAFIDQGAVQMDKLFAGLLKRMDNNFTTLGYGFYDAQTSFQDGYHISSNISQSPIHRYINPQTSIISSIDIKNARKDMNTCLKNRYNICYDLRFYSNQLKTYPQVMGYGKKIEAFRNKYRGFVWDGEFSDVLGATASGNHVAYAVYTRKSDGRKAVIIVNQSENESSTAKVSIDGSTRSLAVASPEKPEAVPCNGTVELLPQSAIIVMEQ